jgi:hypothetical protein
LSFQGLLHCAQARLEGVKVEVIFGIVQRLEKGDALDVIPVIVRKKNLGFDTLMAELGNQLLPEKPQAAAAIQDENLAGLCPEFYARRVAAVAQIFKRRSG